MKLFIKDDRRLLEEELELTLRLVRRSSGSVAVVGRDDEGTEQTLLNLRAVGNVLAVSTVGNCFCKVETDSVE